MPRWSEPTTNAQWGLQPALGRGRYFTAAGVDEVLSDRHQLPAEPDNVIAVWVVGGVEELQSQRVVSVGELNALVAPEYLDIEDRVS